MLLQSRKVAPHSHSPKLLSKVATESRVPKKLPIKEVSTAYAVEGGRSKWAVSQRCVWKSTETIAHKLGKQRQYSNNSQGLGTDVGGTEPGENRGTVIGLTRTRTAKCKSHKNNPILEFPVFPNSKIIGLFRCHWGGPKKAEHEDVLGQKSKIVDFFVDFRTSRFARPRVRCHPYRNISSNLLININYIYILINEKHNNIFKYLVISIYIIYWKLSWIFIKKIFLNNVWTIGRN